MMHVRTAQPTSTQPGDGSLFFMSEGHEIVVETGEKMWQEGKHVLALDTHSRGDQYIDARYELTNDARAEFWRTLAEQHVYCSNDVDR